MLFFLLVFVARVTKEKVKPRKGEKRFFIFFLIFGFSFSTKNKRPSSFFPPNHRQTTTRTTTTTTKRVWTFFIHKRRSDGKAAAEEKREMMMTTRCVVYSCVLMRSLLFLFARCFLDILYAFPSKFLKIKLTILNLLFSRTVAHWRRITRRSVYDHRSFLPPLKGITTERVLRQQNFGVVVKKGRR